MLRPPDCETEKLAAEVQLGRARELMIKTLSILDSTPVFTDCDAFLDHAIHNLTQVIADVKAGASVFTIRVTRRRDPLEAITCAIV